MDMVLVKYIDGLAKWVSADLAEHLFITGLAKPYVLSTSERITKIPPQCKVR